MLLRCRQCAGKDHEPCRYSITDYPIVMAIHCPLARNLASNFILQRAGRNRPYRNVGRDNTSECTLHKFSTGSECFASEDIPLNEPSDHHDCVTAAI
jgi:hypothetical protein